MLVALIPACGESPSAPAIDVAVGTYSLRSVDDQALPTRVPCGGFTVVDGAIVLTRSGMTAYTMHYVENGTNRIVTYSGTGMFRQDGETVELVGRGQWSNQTTDFPMHVVLSVGDRALFRRHVGMECDASSTEAYRLN